MLWAALLAPSAAPPERGALPERAAVLASAAQMPPDERTADADVRAALASWALRYTPHVAGVADAVLVELAACVRLWGGKRALHARIEREARELGAVFVAWAPHAAAAHALARGGVASGFRGGLAAALDALPLAVLDAAAAQGTTLAHLGCRTLADLRALPRAGLARRFGPALVAALDAAYGLQAVAPAWVTVPERFCARLELAARVETAPALLFGARRLLMQLQGWLTARHAGVRAFVLRWAHDTLCARAAGTGGELTVHTARPMRDVDHLARLLAERLAPLRLAAAVGGLELEALQVEPLAPQVRPLLPDARAEGEALALVLERLAARLGPERVLRAELHADLRPEWMQRWRPALTPALSRMRERGTSGSGARVAEATRLPQPDAAFDLRLPQPGFLFDPPLPLEEQARQPLFEGEVLELLLGPHRLESGWWHRVPAAATASPQALQVQEALQIQQGWQDQQALQVQRDYWLAWAARAGLLWVFCTHPVQGSDATWFAHGRFA